MTRFDWMARGNLGANIGLHWDSMSKVHRHWPMMGADAGRAVSWALNLRCSMPPRWGHSGTMSPVKSLEGTGQLGRVRFDRAVRTQSGLHGVHRIVVSSWLLIVKCVPLPEYARSTNMCVGQDQPPNLADATYRRGKLRTHRKSKQMLLDPVEYHGSHASFRCGSI